MKLYKTKLFSLLASLVLLAGIATPSVFADDNTTWEPLNPGIKEEQTDEGDSGMVVSAHPLASEVGAQVLNDGGNAVDAAVAMQFALNVVEPMMSGIGGGGFMMYYDADTEEISLVNSRERAPAGATADMFMEDGKVLPFQDRVRSGKSVGIPGTLKGLETALDQWGSGDCTLEDLLQPAISLAEEGHEVNWSVAAAIDNNAEKLSNTAAKDVFLPGGDPLQEGDLLVQEDLANTFKLIANQGTDAFYHGEIGEAIAEEVQKFGGSMVPEDLSNYEVSHEEPVRGNYQGYDIVTMPPPSSGGLTMLQLLKMSEQLDLTSYEPRSYEKYHYLVESMHLAYADRAQYMGDPEHVDVPKEGLLNDDYIAERIKSIQPDVANPEVGPGNPWDYEDSNAEVTIKDPELDKEDGETTHFSVADRWGNMVSYTTTIEQVFGSGIMADGYGIMLNNELTDFDAVPGGVNEVAPNKRPLSSMTPTIVLKDGKPYMTVGSPGGTTIITSVTQTIMNVIGYEMGLKDAIEEPRIYSNVYPNIRWEIGIPDTVRTEVAGAGHVWESAPVDIGNVNSILIDRDDASGKTTYIGAADSTRQGTAIGINASELITIEDMKNLLEDYIDSGDVDGPLKSQLTNRLDQAQHQLEKGHEKQADKKMNDFLKHIQKDAMQRHISEDAKEDLIAYAEGLLDTWGQDE